MKITESYSCDGPSCKAAKGDTNHWWKLYVYENAAAGFLVLPWSTPPSAGLRKDLGAGRCQELHLCGEHCLQRRISLAIGVPVAA